MAEKRRALAARTAAGWVIALALLAAACGGDGDTDDAADAVSDSDAATTDEASDGPEEPEVVTFDDATDAYARCMEDNGSDQADVPEGTDLGALAEMGEAPPNVQAEMGIDPGVIDAHAECWPIVEDAIAAGVALPQDPSPSTTVDEVHAQQMRDAVACLNDRGWDFLEPGTETGPLAMAPRDADFDWDDATFLGDQRDCQRQAGIFVP